MSTGKELTNWVEKMAALATQEAAQARPSSGNISFRSGMISYESQAVPDNKLDCIIVGVANERTYYEGTYDPDNISNPTCFAIVPNEEEPTPHHSVPNPPAQACNECPWDAWGSAGNGRRGKACQQRKRLVAIPADAVKDAETLLGAEVASMKLPVTSVKNWDNYVLHVARTAQRPTWAVVSQVSTAPDAKTQFKVSFNYLEDVDVTLLSALEEKVQNSAPILLRPYDLSATAEEDAPKAKGSKHRA